MNIRHALMASVAALLCAAPVLAQDANVEGRVKKLEKEVGALQKKVFPAAGDKYFEPEITADPGQPKTGSVGTSTVTDLLARVDTLEAQMTSLTGQLEQQQKNSSDLEARLTAIETQLKGAPTAVVAIDPPVAAATKPPATTPVKPAAKPPATTTTAKPAADRVAAVTALQKPPTGDAFEDAYNYGYRLWEAKYYPEAQAQLNDVNAKFAKHSRISFARNLLGRAYLDDKQPAQAVKILYANYKDDPKGGRAPESLFYLGEALHDLDKSAEACDAFAQLVKAYPVEAKGRLAPRLAEGRAAAKCK